MKYYAACIIIFTLSAIILSGCTIGRMYEIGPVTQFIHPNSNVKALGPVSVKKIGNFSLIQPSLRTGNDDLALYNLALSKVAGANAVIDYYRVTNLKYIYPLPFFWTESKLEGTAAKVEIGQQELR
jgi:hypothetical protein